MANRYNNKRASDISDLIGRGKSSSCSKSLIDKLGNDPQSFLIGLGIGYLVYKMLD